MQACQHMSYGLLITLLHLIYKIIYQITIEFMPFYVCEALCDIACKKGFAITIWLDFNLINTEYFFVPVLHGRYAFSRGGETITPIPDPSATIGQRVGMAKVDIERVNKLYECCESS